MKKFLAVMGCLAMFGFLEVGTVSALTITPFGDAAYDESNGEISAGAQEIAYWDADQSVGYHGITFSFEESAKVDVDLTYTLADGPEYDWGYFIYTPISGHEVWEKFESPDSWVTMSVDIFEYQEIFSVSPGDTMTVGVYAGIDTNLSIGVSGEISFSSDPGDMAPVPEPATMLLFGTGLMGLVGYGRRKTQKKA